MFARVFHISAKNKLKIFISFLMAFQAGAINTGGFIICNRFVSHVTGFASLFGVDFAKMNWGAAVSIFTVPLCFLLGVMFAAYFVDVRITAKKKPQYTLLIITIAFLMFLSAFGGLAGWFGPVVTPFDSEPNYLLIAILCLACGIQNASITSASGAVIRTTHLTGITTDLGLGLMKILVNGKTFDEHPQETRATLIRLGIIGSFILGSAIGAFAFYSFGFLGFLLPAGISTGLLLWDLLDQLSSKPGVQHG